MNYLIRDKRLDKIKATETEISRLVRSAVDKKSLPYELTLSSLKSRLEKLKMELYGDRSLDACVK